MIHVRCPICEKSFEIASLDDLPTFPFCSERCRLVDLGRWLDDDYALPSAEPESAESSQDPTEGNGRHE